MKLMTDRWVEKNRYGLLAGIIAVYIAVVAGNITRWSIWFDEGYSAYLMRFGWFDLTHYTAVDVHPPFYYWLLKIWTSLFGTSELGMRSMSLLFGCVALVGIFVLIRRMFRSSKWALIATTAAAFAPMLVRFSHEARMYTLLFAIVIWATYVLIRMQESNAKRWWLMYGVLLAAGMLTHYFVALAWLAHWVWRVIETKRGKIEHFWQKKWIYAHAVALLLYSWWLPTAVSQLTTAQRGFWVGPLSGGAMIDFLGGTWLYRQAGELTNWWALAFMGLVVAGTYVLVKGTNLASKRSRSSLLLIAAMVVVPLFTLSILSMPPLQSVFLDRYIAFAQIFLIVLVAIAFAAAISKQKSRLLLTAGIVLFVGLLGGVCSVYYYGNYSKNASVSPRTGEVMAKIQQEGGNGEPVIAESVWMYFEAVAYESPEHKVYFLNEGENYQFGSLDVLRDHSYGKIMDLDEFAKSNRYVWYVGVNDKKLTPPRKEWHSIKELSVYDNIDNVTKYRAVLYDTDPK